MGDKRQHIAYVALVVRDYDEAKAYYCGVLGFELIEDTTLADGKRWVLVAPPGSRETRLLLARAATPEQAKRVGDQTGGRVFLFLHTDDFWRDFRAMQEKSQVPRAAAERKLWPGGGFRRFVRQSLGPAAVELSNDRQRRLRIY